MFENNDYYQLFEGYEEWFEAHPETTYLEYSKMIAGIEEDYTPAQEEIRKAQLLVTRYYEGKSNREPDDKIKYLALLGIEK